jgi:hypothetical protein
MGYNHSEYAASLATGSVLSVPLGLLRSAERFRARHGVAFDNDGERLRCGLIEQTLP